MFNTSGPLSRLFNGRKMMRLATSLTLAFAVLLVATHGAYGAMIITHSGATDPTTEGWVPDVGGIALPVGGVINDLGLGLDAWKVDDNTTASGTNAAYNGASALTTAHLVDMADPLKGWVMSGNIRVDDLVANGYNETPDGGPSFQVDLSYTEHREYYNLNLGSDSSGNPIVNLQTYVGGVLTKTPNVTITGSGYHLYEVVSKGNEIDLFVDGVEVISDFDSPGQWWIGDPSRVRWGGASSPGIGAGYFNAVGVTMIPEPSTLTLVLAGLFGLLAYAWRKRR